MRAHMTLRVFGALPVAVDGRRSADQLRAFGIAVSIKCGFLFLFGHWTRLSVGMWRLF
jgi:hypothetical protein